MLSGIGYCRCRLLSPSEPISGMATVEGVPSLNGTPV